jgi:hypothetical protein
LFARSRSSRFFAISSGTKCLALIRAGSSAK